MIGSSNRIKLVKNRVCGECTACCIYFPIETRGLVKLPNVKCENLANCGGCGIHDNLPDLCRDWFCVWRNLEELDDKWRPDRIGVVIEFAQENFPPPFSGRVGFRFTIIDRKKAENNKKLAKFIKNQILNGVPCLLCYGTDEGQNPPAAFLNPAMHKAARDADPKAILNELHKAIKACDNQPKEFLKIENGRIKY